MHPTAKNAHPNHPPVASAFIYVSPTHLFQLAPLQRNQAVGGEGIRSGEGWGWGGRRERGGGKNAIGAQTLAGRPRATMRSRS